MEHREKDRNSSDRKGKPADKVTDHSKSDRSKDKEKEKDCERKKKDKIKDGTSSSSSNLKLLLEEKKSNISESAKGVSLKCKEEGLKTPDKDRDRRDRERDRDSDRHRDKERQRDRPQQAKVNKSKPGDADAERVKSKASPAARDARPKEKRLVNDDLMQTSFERMLSMKDQEIELWHRKHLEKIKQKERERMKQRPSADPGKLKSKDKAKTEACLSKELLRSKSSEGPDAQSRERALKDATGSRTMSLDGRSPSLVSAKAMASTENSLSRSPRPESERSGLMSRSVSMISVASSEDSCQAATLTPRPVEYDSDLTLEASDSQPPFLQSSLASQATNRSPSVNDREGGGLPDAAQCNRAPPAGRHASPYLRAILDEDANSSSEGKPMENSPKAGVPTQPTEEPGGSHQPETSADTEEGQSSHDLTQRQNARSDIDYSSEQEGTLFLQTSKRDSTLPFPSVPQSGAAGQKDSSASDPLSLQEARCLPTDDETECSGKELPSTDVPPLSAASLPTQLSPFTHAKPAPLTCSQPKEPHSGVSMGPSEEAEVDSELRPNLGEDKTPPEGVAVSADRAEEDSVVCVSGGSGPERGPAPLPSISVHVPCSSADESLQGMGKSAEANYSQGDMDVDVLDFKKSRLSSEIGDCVEDSQADKKECVPSTFSSACASPEPRAEGTMDSTDRDRGCETFLPEKQGASAEGGLSTAGAPESRAQPGSEPMEVAPAEEKPETSGGGEPSQSGGQAVAPTDLSSSTSGSSSPQSGDRDSDSSGAKAKVRSLDEDVDLQVAHPRKRKMPRVSSSSSSQGCPSSQQEKDQPSLAAIVDSVKLEEIQPYQTERANPYYKFLHIRRKIEEKRKVLCSVTPQPPQYYDEYVTFNGSYLLDGNPLSKLCIPTITPPPSLPEQLKEMFKQQEVLRMKLRLQHSIEREKLIVSNEQEVLRVHYRAARTLANQTLPFSACTVLLDAEVYNMPQDVQASGMVSHSVESGEDGKTSVRDRFNARQFMSWLQDVDDKFDKLKTCLLMRQQHEAAALNAVQRLEWQLKLQELEPATYKSTSIFEISEFYIPLVEVNDDFDLTPI